METAVDTEPIAGDTCSVEPESASESPTKAAKQSTKSTKAIDTADSQTKEGEKDDRRNQKVTKPSTRSSRPDTTASGSTAEVEAKKFKKEPKDTSDTRSGTSAGVSSPFAGYTASSYLQGLAGLPHPYASLFAAAAADPATAAAANAFLTANPFGFQTSAPTDLSPSKDNGAAGRNHGNESALFKSLNQADVGALRQLISGYREAAALLSRTADELESFLCNRK